MPPNATAVTGNLTVTGQTSQRAICSSVPTRRTIPTSSTLNFPVGDDRANGVTVSLSAAGALSVTFVASSPGRHGPRHLRCDRLLHAHVDRLHLRSPQPDPHPRYPQRHGGLTGPFSSHAAREFHVSGVGVIPANAMVGNLTVTGQTSNGYLYIGPAPVNNPTSSTLNFPVARRPSQRGHGGHGAGGALSVTFVAPSSGTHGPRDLRCDRLLTVGWPAPLPHAATCRCRRPSPRRRPGGR